MARRRPTKIAKRAGMTRVLWCVPCSLVCRWCGWCRRPCKPEKEWLSVPPSFIPAHPTLANFTGVIEWGFPV